MGKKLFQFCKKVMPQVTKDHKFVYYFLCSLTLSFLWRVELKPCTIHIHSTLFNDHHCLPKCKFDMAPAKIKPGPCTEKGTFSSNIVFHFNACEAYSLERAVFPEVHVLLWPRGGQWLSSQETPFIIVSVSFWVSSQQHVRAFIEVTGLPMMGAGACLHTHTSAVLPGTRETIHKQCPPTTQ